MSAPWLVTGAAGMLGRDLVALAGALSIPVVAKSRAELDVADPDAVRAAVRAAKPAVVVNCAAFTKVDDCEEEVATARRINGEAVVHLAAAAAEAGALLVQVSTDFVFDGRKTEPYLEDDPVSPVSEYGRSKLLGEEAARACPAHLVVRTSWLYGTSGWNFIEALRKQVRAGKTELTVVDDQVGSPTSTVDLARALVALVEAGARGTVHFSNAGAVSWFGYAKEIARLHGWNVQVWPISSEMLNRPAPRPSFSAMSTDRFTALTGRSPRPWGEPLAEYVAQRPF